MCFFFYDFPHARKYRPILAKGFGSIMGQLVTRPEGQTEKTDINVYYATYGEGDTYAMDGNEEYATAEDTCGHVDKEDAALSKVANFANFVSK